MNQLPCSFDLIIIGGGPAGVFAAIWAKTTYPHLSVLILEKSSRLLGKVQLSGGGRCNLTNINLNSRTVASFYPRGSKELLGALTRWSPQDTMEWFESKGAGLKTEQEGRVFPATDQSQTIVNCLLTELDRLGIEIRFNQNIISVVKNRVGFLLQSEQGTVECQKLILATGNSKEGYRWAESLGHAIVSPVPSLFTFNISPFSLNELSGVSVNPVELKIDQEIATQQGALLITHYGLSGPAVLKLSAFHARYLSDRNYQANLFINWSPSRTEQQLFETLRMYKSDVPEQRLSSLNPFEFPKSLWQVLLSSQTNKRLSDFSFKELKELSVRIHRDVYRINGKSTHKDEFVTCGGVKTNEINFKSMESKICSNLYLIGELIDIDGVTGGFNLQNGWTTGFIAGSNLLNS